jgi:hypothetical protein
MRAPSPLPPDEPALGLDEAQRQGRLFDAPAPKAEQASLLP